MDPEWDVTFLLKIFKNGDIPGSYVSLPEVVLPNFTTPIGSMWLVYLPYIYHKNQPFM